jgi:hypothetical protein
LLCYAFLQERTLLKRVSSNFEQFATEYVELKQVLKPYLKNYDNKDKKNN